MKTGQWLAANTPIDATVGVNDAGAIRYFSHRKVIDLVGINSTEVALGKIAFGEYWTTLDWLAVCPAWYKNENYDGLVVHNINKVDPKTYSICPCPIQTLIAIFKRDKILSEK